MEIQLSRGESWDPINWFKPATFLSLSQARTWISNVVCGGLLCSVSSVEMIVRFVDIGGIASLLAKGYDPLYSSSPLASLDGFS